MNRIYILCLFVLSFSVSIVAYDLDVTDIIMVKGKITSETDLTNLRKMKGVCDITISQHFSIINVKTDTGIDYISSITDYLRPNGYEFVWEPNKVVETQLIPWHLDRLDQVALPLDSKYYPPGTGEDVNIYIVDVGVKISHPEFDGRASHAYSVSSDIEPCGEHGTWVASLAAGRTTGVAKRANIKDIKVASGSQCIITVSSLLSGLLWIASNGHNPQVISLSLSVPGGSVCVDNVIETLYNNGAIIMSAAGNSGSGTAPCQNSPSRSTGSLSIASIDDHDTRSSFSNYGACVDYFAPGQQVTGANWLGGYVTASGTSASTPLAAGVAAVIIDAYGVTDVGEVWVKLHELSVKDRVFDALGTPNRIINFSDAILLTTIIPFFLLLLFW